MGQPAKISIDTSSAIPVYRQIADQLRAALVSGALQPGDRMPTVRQVAVDLMVNHNTVADAYRALAEEGWLALERGRAAVVRERGTPATTARTRRVFARRLRELVAEMRAAGITPPAIRSEFEAAASEMLPDKSGRE
jgi:GntR family transcriptional regulator